MTIRQFNWQIWVGFFISLFAFVSYPLIFVEWPLTRDLPWANLLLFGIAAGFVFVGFRRAFRSGRGWLSRTGAAILGTLSIIVLGLFVLIVFIAARWMPASAAAPSVGAKAPDFTLTDTNGSRISLSQLIAAPIHPPDAAAPPGPRGVLLIFYRGYW